MNSFIGEVLGFLLFSVEEELADFRQEFHRALVGVGVGLAGPDGVFVELDALVGDAAEDHGAEVAVADGQGFAPIGGGLVIPQHPLRLGRSGVGGDFGGGWRESQEHAECGEEDAGFHSRWDWHLPDGG